MNHRLLIEHLREFDGWALSLSMKSLRHILPMTPEDVLVLSWVKPTSPPMGDNRIYSWEPVIIHGGRKPAGPERLSLRANYPMYTFRPKPEDHVIGEKPEAFCHWVFRNLGLTAEDELVDLFPRKWCRAARMGELPGPDEDGDMSGEKVVRGNLIVPGKALLPDRERTHEPNCGLYECERPSGHFGACRPDRGGP